jgi:hypothetical protein
VLAPKAANAAVQAARAEALMCLEAGPFAGASASNGAGASSELAAAEAVLAQAQLPASAWTRVEAPRLPVWLVYAGRYPEAPLRASREEDLRKLGLSFELIEAPADLAPGLVLSRHAAREEADAWIKQQAPAGLRGVRVVQLPAAATVTRLRVPRADTELAEKLRALPGSALAGGFKPCAARS